MPPVQLAIGYHATRFGEDGGGRVERTGAARIWPIAQNRTDLALNRDDSLEPIDFALSPVSCRATVHIVLSRHFAKPDRDRDGAEGQCGRIELMFPVAGAAMPQVRSGTVKAYAVTTPSHSAAGPDIPTMEEVRLPGFHFANWHALWARWGCLPPIFGAAVTIELTIYQHAHPVAFYGAVGPLRALGAGEPGRHG
jgi:hypothetical protein